jgi:hypothetical protein
MRLRSALLPLSLLGVAAACGSPGEAADAGQDAPYGHKTFDAGPASDAPTQTKTPWKRMTAHAGVVLDAPHVFVIYVGTQGVDLSPTYDPYLSWLVGSTDWWSIMAQYGVGYGALDGSVAIDTATFFSGGMVNNGVVSWYTLDQRIAQIIHAPAADAGAPDAAADAADDAGDASTSTLPAIPKADAYVVFLPDGVNVDLGPQEGRTCQGVGGYHSYDGQEPYAIIPPCRYKVAVSHELAEMVTDPLPGQGWFSDADLNNGGGEIGDLCNWLTYASGNQVTALWSNKDGDCEPAP